MPLRHHPLRHATFDRFYGQLARNAKPLPTALLNAPGGIALFETNALATFAAGRLTGLASHIGSYTLGIGGALGLFYDVTSRTGLRGARLASGRYLQTPNAALATLLTGVTAFSSLTVSRIASASAAGCIWAAGHTATANQFFFERTDSTNKLNVTRTATSSTPNPGTIAVGTTLGYRTVTFSGTAYNAWENGVQTLTAAANVKAPAPNVLSVGANINGGAVQNQLTGDWYCLLLALGVWTTPQRQSIEAAAASYWGIP